MCDCISNAFLLMIILVTGDSLDIKELTYAIIINFIIYIYILIGFEHIYCRHLYIILLFMCVRRRVRDHGRELLIV